MSHILQASEGEVLKLGLPGWGDVVIKMDPQPSGSPVAFGTHVIPPGGAIPIHRALTHHEVWFVHKGQGRAILEGRTMTVVPGMSIVAPPRTWHGLRNTGTGELLIAWLASPPGIETFFRELSHLSSSADAAAIQAIAQRYGVEFRPEEERATGAAPAARHRRRRHRRGGHQQSQSRSVPLQEQQQQVPSPPTAHPSLSSQHAADRTAAAQVSSSAVMPPPGAQRRHQRPRRRSRGGSRTHTSAQGTAQSLPQPSPTIPPREPREASAATQQGTRQPSPPRQSIQRGRRHHRGHVKEVYMGGRWVQVSGEGPVISPGHERPTQRPKSSRRDDETPRGPLSVPW